jgi:hypothetical protein
LDSGSEYVLENGWEHPFWMPLNDANEGSGQVSDKYVGIGKLELAPPPFSCLCCLSLQLLSGKMHLGCHMLPPLSITLVNIIDSVLTGGLDMLSHNMYSCWVVLLAQCQAFTNPSFFSLRKISDSITLFFQSCSAEPLKLGQSIIHQSFVSFPSMLHLLPAS